MKNHNDITFSDYSKRDIHGSTIYPATMIAPLQKDVLESVLSRCSAQVLFDPFCGTGTSLYEAAQLDPSMQLVGCDINPLAYLITEVKLQGVSRLINSDIQKVRAKLEIMPQCEDYNFPYVDKWFRADIKHSLSLLRSVIMGISNKRNRLYFWYHFAVVVRRYANTRSSTFKLHIKKEETINNMPNRVVSDFLARVEENLDYFLRPSYNFKLIKCDVLDWLDSQKDNLFDISITSPPYGDNATTVTYGEFSWLALNWIPSHDLKMEGWELASAQTIDRMSVGGTRGGLVRQLSKVQKELLSPYLTRISVSKQKKVINFFSDYFRFLEQLARVTREYVVMTLGNRTVDRVRIELSDITAEYLALLGYTIEEELTRPIVRKRIPAKTSCVHGRAVSSMNHEYVLIAKNHV